jgi:hypothetical protein
VKAPFVTARLFKTPFRQGENHNENVQLHVFERQKSWLSLPAPRVGFGASVNFPFFLYSSKII